MPLGILVKAKKAFDHSPHEVSAKCSMYNEVAWCIPCSGFTEAPKMIILIILV